MLTIYVSTIEFKVRIFRKEIAEPVLQLLLTFLFKLKTYLSANDFMRTIIYAPYHIGIITIVQSCTISKSTNILTNHCRLAIIVFELNPSNFLWKFAEFFHQYVNISNHMICVYSNSCILCS